MATSPVEVQIQKVISQEGPITFARFMEMALYSPEGGYYTQLSKTDGEGDFFTAPSAHPALGALLALQLEQLWEILEKPQPFFVVEMGAGRGLLAHDILGYSAHLSQPFAQAITYLALDRAHYTSSLIGHSLQLNAQRLLAQSLPFKPFRGCILSNELLDAFPVHRVQAKDGRLLEIYVNFSDERFTEVLGEPSSPQIRERLEQMGDSLPEGSRAELCLQIEPWIAQLSLSLEQGIAITLDYGHQARELYSPERSQGTLRCYFQHIPSGNPYIRVGRQDITAHVDFTSVMRSGASHGLQTLGYTTQRELLLNLGISSFINSLSRQRLHQKEFYANRMAIEELIRPGGMGDFKVLAQGKNVSEAELWGFSAEPLLRQALERRLDSLPIPLLDAYHTQVMVAKYPHLALDFEHLWPKD